MAETGLNFKRIRDYFTSKFSETEEAYISELFGNNDHEKELKQFLSIHFDEIISKDEVEEKNLDHILHKIHFEINTKSEGKRIKKKTNFINLAARIAAILILPLAMFWGIRGYLNYNLGKETWVEIKAPAWTRAQFSLPDGTTGWLNSNSSVKYNGNFNTDRQVALNGEAFFDVVSDKSRPFKVNTNEITVRVLGTRFNIASYDNENNVEIVLEEGEIELTGKEMLNSRIMSPNDLVVFDKEKKEMSVTGVEPKKYLAWTEGKLVFRNDPVDVIARRVARWYNVDVVIEGSLNEDLRLRATFVDEGLEEVMDMLKRSLLIDYKIENSNLQPDDTYTKKRVIISLGKK
jgi:ferric-dicitrate binding protein FerR (iron transport regulator)